MTQHQESKAEIDQRRFPPERWELAKDGAIARAHAARAQMMRECAGWLGAHAGAAFRRLAQALRSWRRRQVAAQELGSLDDRSLRDLGINRSEIQSVIAGWDSSRIPRGQVAARLPRLTGATPASRKPATRTIEKNAA